MANLRECWIPHMTQWEAYSNQSNPNTSSLYLTPKACPNPTW
ncbi:hypothetical protein CCACVL1_06384 [Corchorus capsularis]|uniref:Uncharacterized protein n=1 Tax=Corchorus capsularis TaxID=210143 RepID=A0A1R3JFV0_COCAP|nr:hypothetical protein CCACVL1_06384 [Corchorus capsularis]